ncbi:hypothetical protein [Ferruginibacter sp. SUN106]|uniref:hypothetical protein n=1 Tax=Ferruginibacter sp. SUN106 TaxID=2978348 RepID=UPI003D36E28E
MSIKMLFFFSLLSLKVFGQSTAANDSLIAVMCKTLAANKATVDTEKIKLVVTQHLNPYLQQFDNTKAEEISDAIFIRAQRQCKDFADLIFRLTPKQSDWQMVDKKPVSRMEKKNCIEFLKIKKYFYLEANGDTVNLSIENGLWTDHFKDSTFSTLKFRQLNNCEFEIEFISSNNSMRQKLSNPGDKYRYQILEKLEGSYLMSAEIVGGNQFMTFKIYY